MNFKIGKYEIIWTGSGLDRFSSKAEVHGFNVIGMIEYATISYWVDDKRVVQALPIEKDGHLDDVKIIRIDPEHFLATTDPAIKPIRFEVGITYASLNKGEHSETVIVSTKYSSPNDHTKYIVLDDSKVFKVLESNTGFEYIKDGDFVVRAIDTVFKPF